VFVSRFPSNLRWRLAGRTTLPAGSTVTAYLNGLGGQVIGSGTVQAGGTPRTWTVSVDHSTVVAQAGDTVTIQASAGGPGGSGALTQ
jgi:hypothetical protein